MDNKRLENAVAAMAEVDDRLDRLQHGLKVLSEHYWEERNKVLVWERREAAASIIPGGRAFIRKLAVPARRRVRSLYMTMLMTESCISQIIALRRVMDMTVINDRREVF